MASVAACLCFAGCNNNDAEEKINLQGKWFIMTEEWKELLIISEDHSILSTGAVDNEFWTGIKGKIELDGDTFSMIFEDDDNSYGTYTLKGNKLTLIIDGDEFVYTKMEENFSMSGEWECSETLSFINAVEDELLLPSGSIVNGEEIITSIPTENIKGEFVDNALETYFRNIKFDDNGKISYTVTKDGEDLTMTKDYQITDNIMKVTGKVGNVDIDSQFIAFLDDSKDEAYLFLTKESIADMFIGYGLMLREGDVSEGSDEALEEFRESFLEVFENFAVIIYLSRK